MKAEPNLQGIFDNQSTMRRECYHKGRLVVSVAAEALMQKDASLHVLHKDWRKPWGNYPDLGRDA